MNIYVPSYKRSDNVLIRSWLKDCILCVHEFEAKEYEQKQGNILVMPDSIRGNMAKVRNWILDNAIGNEFVMMDDDVKQVGYLDRGKSTSVDSVRFYEKLDAGFAMAYEVGANLWGVNLQSDPMFYMEYNPIGFNTPVLGPFSCIIKNPLRYDERLSLNEDYDYFLQHIHKYRKVLRFNKWHYKAEHIALKGGCAAHRLLSEEVAQSEVMLKKWGGVVRYDFKRSINPIVRVPF